MNEIIQSWPTPAPQNEKRAGGKRFLKDGHHTPAHPRCMPHGSPASACRGPHSRTRNTKKTAGEKMCFASKATMRTRARTACLSYTRAPIAWEVRARRRTASRSVRAHDRWVGVGVGVGDWDGLGGLTVDHPPRTLQRIKARACFREPRRTARGPRAQCPSSSVCLPSSCAPTSFQQPPVRPMHSTAYTCGECTGLGLVGGGGVLVGGACVRHAFLVEAWGWHSLRNGQKM